MEEWAIDAIANGIIDAKIDQINEEIVIKSHNVREMSKEQWTIVKAKITAWKEKFERMKLVLDH